MRVRASKVSMSPAGFSFRRKRAFVQAVTGLELRTGLSFSSQADFNSCVHLWNGCDGSLFVTLEIRGGQGLALDWGGAVMKAGRGGYGGKSGYPKVIGPPENDMHRALTEGQTPVTVVAHGVVELAQ